MKNLFKSLLIVTALLFGNTACSAEAGKDYKLLSPAQPTNTSKIEVLEFFFYGCSHCYHLNDALSAWEKRLPKDVEQVYVPVIFRDSWEPMAYTMYALEALGKRHDVHDALYKAWNVEGRDLSDEAKISAFLAGHGVDAAKFSSAYHSFAVQSKVARAKQMIRSYGINGTPTLVVEGRYVISGLLPDQMISVLDDVIGVARKARSGK